MITAPSLRVMIDPKFVMEKAGIKPGMRVADLGCGSHGSFVFAAAEIAGDAGIVYAVDIQPSVLQAIKSKKEIWPFGSRVEIIWADLEKLSSIPIPRASINVALLINTLHQSGSQQKIVESAAALLKDGGTLLVIDWTTSSPSFAPQNQYPVDFENLKKYVQDLGMKAVDSFSASRYHFGLKFVSGAG